MLIIWLFVVLIIQSSYTASLTSILTVQQLSSRIRGIDSLITSDEPIGFQVGSFAESYMVEELNISRSRLKALGSPEEYARALELGPDNGGVAAVVDERAYVEMFLETKCKFAIIGSEFTKNGWGFVSILCILKVHITAPLSLQFLHQIQNMHAINMKIGKHGELFFLL